MDSELAQLSLLEGQPGNSAERRIDLRDRIIVRLKVSLVAGKKETTLPRLCVQHSGEECVESDDDVMRMRDLRAIALHDLDVGKGDSAADQKKQQGRNHAKCGPEPRPRCSGRDAEEFVLRHFSLKIWERRLLLPSSVLADQVWLLTPVVDRV